MADAEATSYQVVEEVFLDNEAGGTDVTTLAVTQDNDGFTHTRYQQTYEDLPVFEGQYIVHLDPKGEVYALTDDVKRNIDVDSAPTLTAKEAIELAMLDDNREGGYTKEPEAELMIFARGVPAVLVWRVELEQMDDDYPPAHPIYFIDANSGETIFFYDNIQTGASVGTGSGNHYENVSLNTYYSGGTYYMQDTASTSASERHIATVDMRGTLNSDWNFTDADDLWGYYDTNPEHVYDPVVQASAVDAHYAANYTYEYFSDVYDWYGMDGDYGPRNYEDGADGIPAIGVRVHYGSGNYRNNANWDGYFINLGEGDGQEYGPFTSLDLVAHEWTHGITATKVGLTYADESGALNESWSDVFGVVINSDELEQVVWILANNLDPGDPEVFGRSMSNPHDGNDYGFTDNDQPDHYSERYIRDPACGDSPECINGGVHINSGIPNFVFYLASEGGTNHIGGTVASGIGMSNAADVWFKAYDYLTPGASFAKAREATLQATGQLFGYGGTYYQRVSSAWDVCGVYEPTGYIYAVAGTGTAGYGGDGGPATSAKINHPAGIAVDDYLNVYIADTENNRIRRVTPEGVISTIAGTGTAGYAGDGEAAVDAELDSPQYVAFDGDGNLYLADTGNHVIRMIDGNQFITTIAGEGTQGFSGDNGDATDAYLDTPSGIGFDVDENLYIADTNNNRIRKVDGNGDISTFAGTGTTSYNGDDMWPIYANLWHPTDITFDEAGIYGYISDTWHNQIRRVHFYGTSNISTVVGNGNNGYSGDGGSPTSAAISYPMGVTVTGDNTTGTTVYFADMNNHVIRRADLEEDEITTLAGTGSAGYDYDGHPATSAKLNLPKGVAIDYRGYAYIADTSNQRIRRVTQ